MTDKRSRVITRRELLQSAAAASAAAAVGSAGLEAAPGVGAEPSTQEPATPAPARETYEHLTADEAELLEAIADHLIPADEHGPGAVEARAAHYIDRALGGALADSHDAYRSGLAAFDRYCRSSRGGAFLELSRRDRISALIDIETGGATGAGAGFVGSSAAFFGMVRSHVLQGTFGDPYYGGNANFVGWDLLGYPGVRTAVTPVDQRRLEADELPPYRRSAYDWDEFNKASVRADRGGQRHGD
jgi:gluconate 2-dehydrogenase gamma chain